MWVSRSSRRPNPTLVSWQQGKQPLACNDLIPTLPETNIAPKNWWFPIGISFSRGLFSGAMLVSGRVN